ncbi:MAG: monofunctional biosynthetic peptidoglycan transglycosylase [Woeseiaceae bacterium]|nr:monofunctional biosynthetic peptidoglycan transglycosylase [Woeseiaceae bacterium]
MSRGNRPVLRRKKTKGRSFYKMLVRWLCVGGLTFFCLSLLMVLPFRWIDPPTTAFMLQDDSDRKPVLYEWSAWGKIGTAPPIAVVAAEDQKFASHFGFDLKSIRESVVGFNDGAALRGASTITQQVAKNLYLWPSRSFLRKGIEAYFTVLIEVTWPKKRILEIYLNIAEFGPGIYGVGAASELYFGKVPIELSDAEAAMLAAVLPNPKQFSVGQPTPYLLERRAWIIGQMQRLRREQWSISME